MNYHIAYFNISIAKISLLTMHQSSDTKNYSYLTSYQNSSIFIGKFYYGEYANAQFNLCAKRLCNHQPC